MAGFADLGNQFKALYDSFTIGQKVSIVIMMFFLVIVFSLLIFWAGRPEFQVLYSKLSLEDAQNVVSNIEGKIKYQLSDNGTTILVPEESVYRLRLDLASKGLPKGGVVGFEIFDKTSFGITDFAQRINYKRAVEGELTRTIMQLDAISSAKVMLATPEKKLFEDEQRGETASIVLGLQRPGALSKSQVQGIVYLVSSSVENLIPGNITVIDTKGNVLYKGSSDSDAELVSNQYEFKKQYEANLEKKITTMIEKVVGVSKSVAMVSAEFDFDVINKTEETYDPEKTVVVSEQRSTETTENLSATPSGTPGVRGNVPPTTDAAKEKTATSKGKKTSETINYEVSKVIKNTKETTGELVRLSISLIIDGKYEEIVEEGAKEGTEAEGQTKTQYVPRSDDELDKIRALVMKAVGFDETRGDQIELETMQFQKAEVEVMQAGISQEEKKSIWGKVSRYAASGVMVLLVFLFVIRPMTKWMTHVPKVVVPEGEMSGEATISSEEAAIRAGKSIDDAESAMEREVRALEAEIAGEAKMPEGAKRKQAIKGRLARLADKDPESVSQLVKTWMHED